MKTYRAVVVSRPDEDSPTEENLALVRMEVTFTVGDEYVERFFKTIPPGSVPGTALARLLLPRGVKLGYAGRWFVESMEELHESGLPVRPPYDPRHRAPLADLPEDQAAAFLDAVSSSSDED